MKLYELHKRRTSPILLSLVIGMLAGTGGCAKVKLDTSFSASVGTKPKKKKKAKPPPKEPKAPQPTTDELLTAAVEGDHRTEENKARGKYRHPIKTLEFFGLQPEMTVVEINGAPGWYTEILAPVLAERGQLFVTTDDPEGNPKDPRTQIAQEFAATLKASEALAQVKTVVVKDGEFKIAPDESVDLVVSFRNSHIWWRGKTEADIMGAVFNALKPGGRFGLVTHRAAEGTSLKRAASKGYIPEQHVVETAEAAGFELVEHSEINANPKDTKDYREGVWALPPVLAGGEKNREKLLEIGESDRMTLVFRKPGAPDISEQLAGAAAKAQEEFKKAKEKFNKAADKAKDAAKDAAKKGKKALKDSKAAAKNAAKNAGKAAGKIKKPKSPF